MRSENHTPHRQITQQSAASDRRAVLLDESIHQQGRRLDKLLRYRIDYSLFRTMSNSRGSYLYQRAIQSSCEMSAYLWFWCSGIETPGIQRWTSLLFLLLLQLLSLAVPYRALSDWSLINKPSLSFAIVCNVVLWPSHPFWHTHQEAALHPPWLHSYQKQSSKKWWCFNMQLFLDFPALRMLMVMRMKKWCGGE